MPTVAIICEYNPFHNGHLYQLECIRRDFGADTEIIAVMSGNYTQRGVPAIADKYLRAECAVACGVNLVLELPFPYSACSAEFFARGAMATVLALGAVDYLSFGVECEDPDRLWQVAKAMISREYRSTLAALAAQKENASVGHPALAERACRTLLGCDLPDDLFSPNNLLALEYLKVLLRTGSAVKAHFVRRSGAPYRTEEPIPGKIQSAATIRRLIMAKDASYTAYLPTACATVLARGQARGVFPCDAERLAPAVLAHLRLQSDGAPGDLLDAGGGLYNRLRSYGSVADSLSSLISLSMTKKYTRARIRRAVLFSFLGVTSSEVKKDPAVTFVLAADAVGQRILRRIKTTCSLPLLTKPAHADKLTGEARDAAFATLRADSVFSLTMPSPGAGTAPLRATPFMKK